MRCVPNAQCNRSFVLQKNVKNEKTPFFFFLAYIRQFLSGCDDITNINKHHQKYIKNHQNPSIFTLARKCKI